MKYEHIFIAERAAAQHCEALLRNRSEPADMLPTLRRAGEHFARVLAPALADMIGGDAPTVTALAPSKLLESELSQILGEPAANSVLAPAVPGVTLLASIEGAAVLRLVDRAYGGKGVVTGPMPHSFPFSAQLLIERLEALVAAALGKVLGEEPLRVLERNSRIAELTPFQAGSSLVMLPIEVMEDAHNSWVLRLVLPQAALDKMLGSSVGTTANHLTGSADPTAAPFADVPLPLVATLVDMKISLAAISRLEPGSVLPVTVARAVPLSIAGTVIARGSIGAQDDLAAIRLSHITA